MPYINVTLHRPKHDGESRKINDIKALREATRILEAPRSEPDSFGNRLGYGACMGLAEAKDAIEEMYRNGNVTIRMTPERYGYFMVNRRDIVIKYDWQVKESAFYWPTVEAKVFTL